MPLQNEHSASDSTAWLPEGAPRLSRWVRSALPLLVAALAYLIHRLPIGSPTNGIISMAVVLLCAWFGGLPSAFFMAPVLLVVSRLQRDAADRWASIPPQEMLALTIIFLLTASMGLAGQYRRRIRRITEEQSQRLRDQARALNRAPIIFRDLDGRITQWSDGAQLLFGWTAEEAVGQFAHDLLSSELPIPLSEIQSQISTVGQWQGEVVCRHKSGAPLNILAHSILCRDKDDKPVGAAVVLNDVTALRKAEAALLESDRRKDEFLSILAHELRNPLAPIRTGLELIAMAKHDPDEIDSTCDMMKRQMKQLVTLIDDLLDVSRITRGKLELKISSVDLAEVVRTAVEAATPQIEASDHQFTATLPAIPVHVDADPHRLAQILSNLLDNAAKYTPAGGRISLTATCREEQLVLTVKDNGIGIPPDKLEASFEMFTRMRDGQGTGPSGLGIGLALVKSLVEMHGGRVQAASDGPGKGAEFSVYLPVPHGAPARPESPPLAAPPANGASRRVLVVDDNADAARALSLMIKMLGHEVHVAYDGHQAVEAAEQFQPNVVFLDLGMPRLDGCGAAQQIRRQPWGADMMLVALTGWGQDADRLRTKEAGFDHHLVKPAAPEAILRLLHHTSREPASTDLEETQAV